MNITKETNWRNNNTSESQLTNSANSYIWLHHGNKTFHRHSQLKVMIIESLMNKICDLLRKKNPTKILYTKVLLSFCKFCV